MWNSDSRTHGRPAWFAGGASPRPRRGHSLRPIPEDLEDRRLLTASLAPISNLSVPAEQGYTLPLDGSGTTDAQNFTVTSSNPAIAAEVAQGQFWTLNVTYTDPSNAANDFSGPVTFQLFSNSNLTPNTASKIESFTNDGYYSNIGKSITRVATGFPGATDFVIQGGAPNSDGTGSSGQPGTPFPNENVQQLAFTGTDQLGMANSAVTTTGTNDTQFFITTGSPNSELGYNYTIFGQMVSGQSTLAKLTQIPVTTNPNLGGEVSLPVNAPIYSASLSTTNPNGVVVLDTTQSTAGQTSTITVTATDPTDGTTASQSFLVTVGAYSGPTASSLVSTVNFKPLANPTDASTTANTAMSVTLAGPGTFPVPGASQALFFSLVSQPADGTVSNFNASTGTFTYTPKAGFTGTDTFQYMVASSGPNSGAPAATSNVGTVTISVAPTPPPLVSLAHVSYLKNRNHRIRQIELTFSGSLDASGADKTASYHLATPGKHGSFTARNAGTIKLRSATYDDLETVALVPRKPFALTGKVEVVVYGEGPSALRDGLGRLIDGNHDGQPGGDAIAILSKRRLIVEVSDSATKVGPSLRSPARAASSPTPDRSSPSTATSSTKSITM